METTVFIGNLTEDTDKQIITSICSLYGQVCFLSFSLFIQMTMFSPRTLPG